MEPLSLFDNLNGSIFAAVNKFLSRTPSIDKKDIDKLITTTLRIPPELKVFFECVAESESTSINTAIINTLNNVKEHTVQDYHAKFTKFNVIVDQQLKSFFEIIETHQIDYNDIPSLLTWVTEQPVSREDLANKSTLIRLLDKPAQIKLAEIFEYNYDWLSDNTKRINHSLPGYQDEWYKNSLSFINGIIHRYCLDDSVEAVGVSFICNDRDVIRNIRQGLSKSSNENILPIIEIRRNINGVKFETYHLCDSNDINYHKCRSHFVVVSNLLLTLHKQRILEFPYGYSVTDEQMQALLSGRIHPTALFSGYNRPSHTFYVDDLENTLGKLTFQGEHDKYSTQASVLHVLSKSLINRLIGCIPEEKEDRLYLSDQTLLKGLVDYGIRNASQLIKLLQLYSACLSPEYGFCYDDGLYEPKPYIKKEALLRVKEQIKALKPLNTSF